MVRPGKRQLDALLLARTALEMGAVEAANRISLAGVGRWDRYHLCGADGRQEFRVHDLVPPAWGLCVHGPDRWTRLLLCNPGVVGFFTEAVGLVAQRRQLQNLPAGWVRLGDVLANQMTDAMTAPDHP